MSIARFKTSGKFDKSCIQEGTVEIDRDKGLISVRPKGRRRTYTLPLSAVAELICWKVINAEVVETKREKAIERKLRRL